MNYKRPFVNKALVLEKFPGRGGWIFARIPVKNSESNRPFGWIRVKGKIDNYAIKNYNLMPMADGALFLPVKSDIRKIIHKGEGDIIQVTLYLDESDFEIPEDFADCLRQEPAVLDKFLKYPEGEKKVFIEWISAAKTDLTKANRMIRAMNLISHGKRLLEKNSKEK